MNRIKDNYDPESGLYARVAELEGVNARLFAALEKIADPLGYFQKNLKPGEKLNAHAAIQIADNPRWLRELAAEAIAKEKQ